MPNMLTLNHEIIYDSMKRAAYVALTTLSCDEVQKVLNSLRDCLPKEPYFNGAHIPAVYGDVK